MVWEPSTSQSEGIGRRVLTPEPPRGLLFLEEVGVDRDPPALQVVVEGGDEAGRYEPADHPALVVEAFLLELEDVLDADHLALHPGDLADGDDPAGAVGEPRLLQEQVHR